jgi:hypothetical protein
MHVVALATLTLLLAACGLGPGASASPKDAALRDLAARKAQWESKGLDDYAFTVTRLCFCPSTDPLEVTVVDGVATQVTDAGEPLDPAQIQGIPTTIPALFATVAANADAAAMTVEWDQVFGFPSSISVDSIENAIDDEFGITVTSFRPAS